MHLLFIDGLSAHAIIKAICWTLLHSLWQGLALIILATILISIARKSSASIRYNLLTALFVLFITTSALTFILELSGTKKDLTPTSQLKLTTEQTGNLGNLQADTIFSTNTDAGFWDRMVQYFNTHAALIVAIWFILFIVRFVKILAGITYVQRIRHYKTFIPPDFWIRRIQELAQSLHIKYSITLLESAIVKTPAVVGFLKPLILIPIGLLSSLPSEQVEAVLLHELAHVRRRDYLVNLLQSFVEMIFFFNPALLWISALLREERENCCDDIAIGRTKNKKQFIAALLAFQEYRLLPANPHGSMPFAGQKKYLLNRVKRIIYNENKKLNAMEKGIFIFSIAAISFIGFVSMKQIPQQEIKASVSSTVDKTIEAPASNETSIQITDTIPDTVEFETINSVVTKKGNGEIKTIVGAGKNGKEYKLVLQNGESPSLYVDNKKVPDGEISGYEKIMTSMQRTVEERKNKDTEKMKKDHEEQVRKMSELDSERNQLLKKLKELDQKQAKLYNDNGKDYDQYKLESLAKLNLLKIEELKLQPVERENEVMSKLLFEKQMELKKDLVLQNDLQHKILIEKSNQNHNDVKNLILMDQKNKQLIEQKLMFEKQDLLKSNILQLKKEKGFPIIGPIIQDLEEDELVQRQEEKLSFELTGKSFIVNGKKQSDEIHDRYKKKYLNKESDYYKYHREDGNISTSVKQD